VGTVSHKIKHSYICGWHKDIAMYIHNYVKERESTVT